MLVMSRKGTIDGIPTTQNFNVDGVVWSDTRVWLPSVEKNYIYVLKCLKQESHGSSITRFYVCSYKEEFRNINDSRDVDLSIWSSVYWSVLV